MTFGKKPGPPFRKLLNGCGVAMSQRQDRLPAHDTKQKKQSITPKKMSEVKYADQ